MEENTVTMWFNYYLNVLSNSKLYSKRIKKLNGYRNVFTHEEKKVFIVMMLGRKSVFGWYEKHLDSFIWGEISNKEFLAPFSFKIK